MTREAPGAVCLDVRDAAAVARLIGELRPETVINTAYLQGSPAAAAVNDDGARHVARACAETDARLVHVSTDLVFDGTLGRPYRPDDEPAPLMEYGGQKLAGELAVREEHPAALIARTSLIYGGPEPGPHERLALDAAAGRNDVTFFTDELRNPAQVGDLAAALLDLADGDAAGIRHVAGADGVNRHEFACLVVAAAGGDPATLRAGLAAEHSEPRPLDCRLDSDPRLRGVHEILG